MSVMATTKFDIHIITDTPDQRWGECLNHEKIKGYIHECLAQSHVSTNSKNPIEVSITYTNDAALKELNADFRGKDKPTNVLSFPQFESPNEWPTSGTVMIGDLVFSFDTIIKEAREQKKTFDAHFIHLLVHGTLHLLGYDHEEDDDADVMQALEVDILAKFGLPDPYLC